MKRLEINEELLKKCQEDLNKLHKIQTEIIRIENNRKKLAFYFDTDYKEDFEKHQDNNSLQILDQDSIWNVLSEQYELKKELLKLLANTI